MAQKMTLGEFVQRLDALADKLPDTVAVAVRKSLQILQRDVILKISGPYLGVVTGTARRSIRVDPVTVTDTVVEGTLGSPLQYVRAHELGFEGTVNVRAHQRKRKKGGSSEVRAHQRRVKMRARHFFRDAITENEDKINRTVYLALRQLARTGEVPGRV